MTTILRLALACAVLAGPFDACSKGTDATPAPSASAASSVAPRATTAAGSDAEDFCHAQPYKRRCEAGCKAAHASAALKTCGDETKAMTAAVPDQTAFGKCLTACRKPGTDTSCVGAPDREGCECQLRCYRALPPDAIEKAKVAARCYNRAVASACE